MEIPLISQRTWVSGFTTLFIITIFSTRSHAIMTCYESSLYGTPRVESNSLYWSYIEIPELGPKFPDPPKVFDGMAVVADPEDGCQSIAPPPNTTDIINESGNWIAVIKNVNCDFTIKTRNAQNAGYQMVLMDNGWNTIYNEEIDSDTRSKNSDIKIYTVFTHEPAVDKIKESYTYDKKMIVSIIKDDDDPLICYYFSRVPNKDVTCFGMWTRDEYSIVLDNHTFNKL